MSQSNRNMTYQEYLASLQLWPQLSQRGKMNPSPPRPNPFGSNDVELVAGTFKSIRAFRIGEYYNRIVLAPVSTWTTIYHNTKTWYSAGCTRKNLVEEHGSVPSLSCSCGFYSFYSKKIMMGEGANYWLNDSSATAIGVVENAGTVLHGAQGIRSERMRILAITVYGAEVHYWRKIRTMMPTIRNYAGAYTYDFQSITYDKLYQKTRELRYSFPMYATVKGLLAAHPLDAPPE